MTRYPCILITIGNTLLLPLYHRYHRIHTKTRLEMRVEDYRHRVFALERDNERLRQLLAHYQEEMLHRAQTSDADDAGDAGDAGALGLEMEGEEKGGEDGDKAGGDGNGIDEDTVVAALATSVSTGGGDSGEGKAGGRGGALKEKLARAKFLAQEAAEAAAATPTPATITSSNTSTSSTSFTSMCCDSINAPPCARAEALQRQVDALQDELAMRQDEDDAEDNTDDNTSDGEEDEKNENGGGKGDREGEERAMRRVRARSFGQAEAPTPRTGQQQLTTPQYNYTPRGKNDISNLLSISSTGAFMSRRLELVRPSLLLELKRLRRQNTVLRNQRGWRTSPSQLLRSRHHARRRVKLAQQLQDDDVDVDIDVADEGEDRVGVAREIQTAVAPRFALERNTREGGLGARRSILGGEPSGGGPPMGDGNDGDGDDSDGGVGDDECGNDDRFGDGGGTTGEGEQTMVCVGIRGSNSVAELHDPRDVAMNQAWSHISPALHRERGGQMMAAPPPPPPPPPPQQPQQQPQQQRAGGALGKIFSLARVSWGSKGVRGKGGKDGGGKRSPRSSRRGHSRPSLFVRLAGSSARRGGGLLKGPHITIISPSLREAARGIAGEARGMARPFTSSPLPPPLPPDNYSAGRGAGDESDAEQRLFEQQRQHLVNYGVGGSPADAENIEPAVAGYLDDRPGHHYPPSKLSVRVAGAAVGAENEEASTSWAGKQGKQAVGGSLRADGSLRSEGPGWPRSFGRDLSTPQAGPGVRVASTPLSL